MPPRLFQCGNDGITSTSVPHVECLDLLAAIRPNEDFVGCWLKSVEVGALLDVNELAAVGPGAKLNGGVGIRLARLGAELFPMLVEVGLQLALGPDLLASSPSRGSLKPEL